MTRVKCSSGCGHGMQFMFIYDGNVTGKRDIAREMLDDGNQQEDEGGVGLGSNSSI